MASAIKTTFFPTWLLDPVKATGQYARSPFRPLSGRMVWLVPMAVGIAGLSAAGVAWALDAHQFYFSYLVAWVSCLVVTIGAMFVVLIHHLTSARWSVVILRIAESLTWGFPLLAVLSIPVLIGMHDLYHWTHVDVMDPASSHFDPVLKGKEAYLNTPFFLIRTAIYFSVWTVLALLLYRSSIRQDVDADPGIPARQKRISAAGLVLCALTTAFASYDFLMSLSPHWFSTIFGVYVFGAAFSTAHALIALLAIVIQRRNGLTEVVTREHYHDLGKMMFGFTIFWAYIGFSQYMLIWYGNLPEETIWYRQRLENGWEVHSAILLLFHFVVPFWVLLTQGSKRNRAIMAFMAVWFLVMNWFDMHWIAMPVLHPDQAGIHWASIACFVGLLGICLGVCLFRLGRHSLVPQNAPNLARSMASTT